MSRKRRQIEGQGNIFDAFVPVERQAGYSEAQDRLSEIRHRVESGDKSALVFPTESARRIAISQRDDYRKYLQGGKQNVVNSPKLISSEETGTSVKEVLDAKRSGELDKKLRTAWINTDQTLRRTIVQNWRETNIVGQDDPRGEKQAITARLRNARKDGILAPFTFVADIKSSALHPERGNKDTHSDKLFDLASYIDEIGDNPIQSGASYVETLDSALATEYEDEAAGDAAQFVYELGKLWASNTLASHIEWEDALKAYNSQFPNRQIDPLDPAYQSK